MKAGQIFAALGIGLGIALLGYLIGSFGMSLFVLFYQVQGIVTILAAAAVVGLCFLVEFLRKKLFARGFKLAVYLPIAYVPSAVICVILWVDHIKAISTPYGVAAGLGEGLTAFGCSIAYGLFLVFGVLLTVCSMPKNNADEAAGGKNG